MKAPKNKRIAVKVTSHILIGLVIVFIVLTWIIASSITKDLVRRESDKLTLLATENASVAREFMESILDKQSVIVNTILNVTEMEEAQKLQLLSGLIADTQKSESHALTFFYAAEPNTLMADSPAGYLISSTGTGVHSVANMFDGVNQEIYEKAKAGKQMMIADPFDKTVDGKAYKVISVLLPVVDAQNRVLGVVGANIDTPSPQQCQLQQRRLQLLYHPNYLRTPDGDYQ